MTERRTPSTPEDLLAELTLAEKCDLLVGKDMWTINGCERLGIPEWTTSDGPIGVRGRERTPGLVAPGPSALASTWDLELVERIGSALGVESKDRNVDLLLGPTTNLHRSPRGGRHFESYSEDPFLSSRLGVAYINGVQANGVGACIKHFVANDQETERFTINVEVGERALREVYLPPFEAAVKEADVKAVMGAYNDVNGSPSCSHPELLNDILRDEWGFNGIVISDWYALKDLLDSARGQLDIEMPGPGRFWGGQQLARAVASGDVDERTIDEKVLRVLSFLRWASRLDTESNHAESSNELDQHRRLVYQAAAGSTVLVRNRESLLPLARDRSVALIGPGVANTAIQGGGSAELEPYRSSNLLDALSSRLRSRLVGHARGADIKRLPRRINAEWLVDDNAVRVDVFDSKGFEGPIVLQDVGTRTSNVYLPESLPDGVSALSIRQTIKLQPGKAGSYALAGIGVGHVVVRLDGETVSDSDDHDFILGLFMKVAPAVVELSADQEHTIEIDVISDNDPAVWGIVDFRMAPVADTRERDLQAAEALARSADTAVVVVGSTMEWESEGADRTDLDLPGGQDDLVRRVIAANPNTVVVLNCGAPMTMPWLDDAAAVLIGWYPGQEGADAIADVLVGLAEPGGRMPTTWAKTESDTPAYGNFPGENGVVRYDEGLFVGYRHYDRQGVDPLIPFGHGGSYATFAWGSPDVNGAGTDWTVDVKVQNTGDRFGSDVVQVYVGRTDGNDDHPDKWLAGFAKLAVDAGAEAVASIQLGQRSFAYWNVDSQDWRVDPGIYRISVGASAVDIRSTVDIEL